MNPNLKTYDRAAKEKMIWKHIHHDFKGSNPAEPSIMLPASMHSEYGSLAYLKGIDDKGLNKLFESALKKESSQIMKNIFTQVFDDTYPHLDDSAANQWSDSFEDMREFANGVEMTDVNREKALSEIDRLEVKFNKPQKLKNDFDGQQLSR